MSENKVNWLQYVLEVVKDFKMEDNDALFCLLTSNLEDDEIAELPKYQPLILKAVSENKEFNDPEVKTLLSNLPLSYLLGLPMRGDLTNNHSYFQSFWDSKRKNAKN